MNRNFALLGALTLLAVPAIAADAPDPAYEEAVTCAAIEALLSNADAPPMDAATYAKKAEAILDGTDPKLSDYAQMKVSTRKASGLSAANDQIGGETKALMEAWGEKTPQEQLDKFNACAAAYGA